MVAMVEANSKIKVQKKVPRNWDFFIFKTKQLSLF
jgi:hypothetical protein